MAETSYSRRFRFIAQRLPARLGWRKWQWASEEKRGSEWVLRKDGEAWTREGALAQARRAVFISYDPDREEQVAVIRVPFTAKEPEPTPLPPELLSDG